MKKLSLRSAIAGTIAGLTVTLAATSAFAVEAEQWNPPAGSLTRAEVVAELRAAQASGQMDHRNEAYDGTNDPSTAAAGTLRRQQVQTDGTAATHHADGTAATQHYPFDSTYVY
ncbi:MAG TPA: DUF4148 domain-containing protein [Albitalea sp.]|nr:DUF4148 domain-containing protein [Albitalea sp.]